MRRHLAKACALMMMLIMTSCGRQASLETRRGTEMERVMCDPAPARTVTFRTVVTAGSDEIIFAAASDGADHAVFFVHPRSTEKATLDEFFYYWEMGTLQRKSFSDSVGRPVRVLDVAYDDGMFVAAGFTDRGLAIWHSQDAAEWKQAHVKGISTIGEEPNIEISHGPAGWLVIASQPGIVSDRVWSLRSSDGTRWESPRQIHSQLSALTDLAGNGQGYLAVGDTFEAGADLSQDNALSWYSRDGYSWTEVLRSHDRTGLSSVTASENGFLGTGFDASAPAIWTTGDGDSWLRFRGCPSQTGTADNEMRSILVTEAGWVAFGKNGLVLTRNGDEESRVIGRLDTGATPDFGDSVRIGQSLFVVSRGSTDSIHAVDPKEIGRDLA